MPPKPVAADGRPALHCVVVFALIGAQHDNVPMS
jgi:hypothetical protein